MVVNMADQLLRLLSRFRQCFTKPARDGGDSKKVHIVLSFFFLVNYQLGMGFLGLPFGFFHGGILAGALTLAVMCLLCYGTAMWLLEVLSRAQAIVEFQLRGETSALVSPVPKFRILQDDRKFEVGELCGLFLGRWAKYGYVMAISVTCFIYLLGYSTVAASSWAVNLPLDFANVRQCNNTDFFMHTLPSDISCRNGYWFSLFLFACIVVPLSMISLKEQAIVQVLMSILRFVTVGMISIFVVANLISTGTPCTCNQPWGPLTNNTELVDDYTNATCDINSTVPHAVFHFRFEAWTVAVTAMTSALALHPAIPTMTHPIRQKKHIKALMRILFIAFTLIFMMIGVLVPLWWRNCINETCTLNWDPLKYPQYDIGLRIFSYYVILFPSVDVITAYPLAVLLVVNNIYMGLFGKDSAEASKSWRPFIILVFMKFLVSLAPILVALAVSNLVTVLKYSGFSSFFHSFVIPIVLQLSSQWVCYKMFKQALQSNYDLRDSSSNGHMTTEEKTQLIQSSSSPVKASDLYMTPYSSVFSHWPTVAIVAVVSVILFGLTFSSLFNTSNL